jgi:preprotein translocase subunit SecD
MNRRPLLVTLAVTLTVVVAAAIYIGLGNRPNLGLDLQGGISAIYTPQLPEGEPVPDDFEDILDQAIEVIRTRVDSLGVAEPDISRSGTDVLVQLPGVSDADRLRELIGTTAQLTFRPVSAVFPPGSSGWEQGPDCAAPVDEREELADDESGILCGAPPAELAGDDADAAAALVTKYEVGPAALTGDRIDDAFPVVQGQGYSVSLDLDRQGAEEFAAITGELACERDLGQPGLLAIVLDGVVESAPSMNPDVRCGVGITGGRAQITTGSGLPLEEQRQEAEDLALVLRTGALPISLEPATFETVSPTLGTESLRAGLLAGLIGLVLVGVWLVIFYRWLGLVALGGLGIFGVVLFAIIALLGQLGFALTLAGVAGIIVSIGITADSSIIFFERIRDEVNLGKTVRSAVRRAFDSAFRTNLAGNTVTLAAAVILYFLAVGPVRGFALMLGIATVLDLLIMYFYTRPTVFLLSGTKLLSRRTVRAAKAAPREPAMSAGGAR